MKQYRVITHSGERVEIEAASMEYQGDRASYVFKDAEGEVIAVFVGANSVIDLSQATVATYSGSEPGPTPE